jgi:hypothetical protein
MPPPCKKLAKVDNPAKPQLRILPALGTAREGAMELSFREVNSADASYLAQELELELVKAGVPSNVIALKRESSEHMALGAVLGVDVETALHAIGAAGYLACFGKCLFEIAGKHRVPIRIKTDKVTVDIPAHEVDLEKIKLILEKIQ